MSKIALSPNASGTGTFTIASPNSNTDRTFTLPDVTGEVLTTAGGTFTGPITGTDITLSGGVYLGGSTAANLLDDYEEGTFTPVVFGRTTAGTGTYTRQNGYYTKVGNLVRIHIDILLTAHTGTGAFAISGLPFTTEGTVGNNPVFSISAQNLTFSNQLVAGADRGADTLGIFGMSSATTFNDVNIDGSCDINITGTYITT